MSVANCKLACYFGVEKPHTYENQCVDDDGASVEAVASSDIEDTQEHQRLTSPRPILDVPDDPSYTMKKLLDEQYRRGPWLPLPLRQSDGK